MPPCVPSSPGLEDAGCEVQLKDVQLGTSFSKVLGSAEAMDLNRILAREPGMMRILHWARNERLPMDGHCPELKLSNRGLVNASTAEFVSLFT